MPTSTIIILAMLYFSAFMSGCCYIGYQREKRNVFAKIEYLQICFLFLCVSLLISACFVFFVA